MREGLQWKQKRTQRCAAALLSYALAAVAHAQLDSSALQALGASTAEESPRMEVTQTTLPRFDAWDTTAGVPRVDLSLLPPSGSGLGLAFGIGGFQQASLAGAAAASSSHNLNVDLGVQWRHVTDDKHRVDIAAYRRLASEGDASPVARIKQSPTYVARVELNMAPVKKPGFVVDRGVGLQLESGARITVRRSNGKPMLYYRSTF